MGLRWNHTHWTRGRDFSIRIPKIPSFDFIRSRSLAGATLILAAVVLGVFAQHLSESESLLRWKRESAPQLTLWVRVLKSFGYQEQTDPAKAHPDLRSLPMLASADAQVWMNSERTRIAVFEGTHEGGDPRIFFVPESAAHHAKSGKALWTPFGRGWDGLDALVLALNQAPERSGQPGSPVIQHKTKQFHDPRELIY